MNSREKIVERIAKLRAKAEGTESEFEAIAFFEKAELLMESYEIKEAEIALLESKGKIQYDIVTETISASRNRQTTSNYKRKSLHRATDTLWAVNKFTDTKCVVTKNRLDSTVSFTGDKPDVEIAKYLYSIIESAMDREFQNWKTEMGAIGYGAKSAFQTAMASRIGQRLSEMSKQREEKRKEAAFNAEGSMQITSPTTAAGTALVLVDAKKEAVERAYAEKYPKLGRHYNYRTSYSNNSAWKAGQSAGNRVRLNRAINNNERKALR